MSVGIIQTGTYTIQSIASGGFATLNDANRGSSLIASTSPDSDNIKFNITKLSNNQYYIASYVWANYAFTNASPNSGDRVTARADTYQWIIKETGTKGQYLIYPPNNDGVFWGLENSNPGTPVKLISDDSKGLFKLNRIIS